MNLGEALAYAEDSHDRWVRLGVDLKTGIWTYMCPKCGAWFKLVTLPKMPDLCPKCNVACRQPIDIDPGTSDLLKKRVFV